MTYACLEQRMAQGYMDMLPPFVPDEAAPVSRSEQERFYNLIKDLYRLAFDEPLLFVPSLHEDDAYPSRYKKPYGKPNLIIDMRKFTKAVDALLQKLFLLGQGGDTELNKRQQVILSRLGIEDHTHLPAAWVWMSNREGADVTAFSHCLFDKHYPYTSDIYARLLGENAFRKLEKWMLDKGYKRYDRQDITASDCRLSITIANPKWSDSPPSGGFEYKIRHAGISAQYDAYTENPAVFGLCIPNGLKPYLLAFDAMDAELQEFVVARTKQCDGCNYCIQTDKTGTRPKAYIPVQYHDEEHHLCPYFPGYRYCWTHIDDGLADKLINMLTFLDRFI